MIKKFFSKFPYFPFLILLTLSFFNVHCEGLSQKNKLNVLLWSGNIDPKLIEKFENVTGIQVTVNLMDSDEAIEAKLLSGEAGFDVISPTLSPFYIRQMKLGLYRELTEEDIPNIRRLNPKILKLFGNTSINIKYGIPLSWGSVGFAYNYPKIRQFIQDDPMLLGSWKLLHDPNNIEKLKNCNVLLLDDPLEVFLSLYFYHHKKFDIQNEKDLGVLTEHLKKIIPFVKKFISASDAIINALVTEKACLVQCFSGEARKAAQLLKQKGKENTIHFVRPTEGYSIFMDMLVVPLSSKNPKNAFKFINFMLDPEHAAQNFKYALQASSVQGYEKYLSKEYTDLIEEFPSHLKGDVFKIQESLSFRQTKKISNAWLRARLNI
jgi:spermidine/putrescine-binding protein